MSFRAICAGKTAAGQQVRVVEMEEAELMEGDLTVRVTHASVNYKDDLALSGQSAILRRFPTAPGIDLAGIFEKSAHPGFCSGGMDRLATVAPFILRGVSLIGVDSGQRPTPQRLAARERLARDLDRAKLKRMTRGARFDDAFAVGAEALAGKTRRRVAATIAA
jgi:NADPH:quinone reductase-like Zn-dependent oxidoreductase